MRWFRPWQLIFVVCVPTLLAMPDCASAAELTAKAVLNSIKRAKQFLVNTQEANGSWTAAESDRFKVGVSSLALLSLINAGMTVDDEPVRKGLNFLRAVKEPAPDLTYEVSLMISVLAAAKDGRKDKTRIAVLAQRLEQGQITKGENAGSWTYSAANPLLQLGGDRSNGQFAILGLRDAAHAGIPITRQVWERARRHWRAAQNPDGGWGYTGLGGGGSTGSMTVAGISTLVITNAMLRDDKDIGPDGKPNCCAERTPDPALQRGLKWLESHFSVGHNPGASTWLLYYLYGLERAGRLSGHRFFGNHDWYREGAKFLIDRQAPTRGSWRGVGSLEADPVVGTSLALLSLSKGLAPVLINKLQYGTPNARNANPAAVADNNWNKHPDDVRNLTDLISGLPKWPKLLTWQIVNLQKVDQNGGVADLLQSPILYLSGKDAPEILKRPSQISLLREYVDQGGFIFAVANCQSTGFHDGFHKLVRKMYPDGDAELKSLPDDHSVWRSEYLLDPTGIELEGVDFGCRTVIVYSPDDLSCFWDKWARQDPPGRPISIKTEIIRATQIGVNIVAYATGREPPDKLERQDKNQQEGQQDKIERGLLQVAKLRHPGAWDTAPRALRNLLMALNRTVGMVASTKQRNLPATDPNLFKYPLIYMHGRTRFQLGRQEREQLRKYFKRGGLLFADACCGSRQFDVSFRDLMTQLYPQSRLKRIPADHEIFSNAVGHNIRSVKRRRREVGGANKTLQIVIETGEPFLEGIQLDGRYVVIYSKYDISCALERQASVACSGYITEDAIKIGVNVVLYAMLQDAKFADYVK